MFVSVKAPESPNVGDFMGFFNEMLPNTSIERQNEGIRLELVKILHLPIDSSGHSLPNKPLRSIWGAFLSLKDSNSSKSAEMKENKPQKDAAGKVSQSIAQLLARHTTTFQGAQQLAKAPNCVGKPLRWQH